MKPIFSDVPDLLAEARQQLITAGIGDRFLSSSLSAFGTIGANWLAAYKDAKTSKKLLKAGTLAYFKGKYSREFAHTLAGAILLYHNASVNSVHLSDLADYLDTRDETLNELQSCTLLVVTEFANLSSRPISDRSAFRVESFLLERTETAGKTLFLVGDVSLTQMNANEWWTPRFVNRISESFLQETIDHAATATA